MLGLARLSRSRTIGPGRDHELDNKGILFVKLKIVTSTFNKQNID